MDWRPCSNDHARHHPDGDTAGFTAQQCAAPGRRPASFNSQVSCSRSEVFPGLGSPHKQRRVLHCTGRLPWVLAGASIRAMHTGSLEGCTRSLGVLRGGSGCDKRGKGIEMELLANSLSWTPLETSAADANLRAHGTCAVVSRRESPSFLQDLLMVRSPSVLGTISPRTPLSRGTRWSQGLHARRQQGTTRMSYSAGCTSVTDTFPVQPGLLSELPLAIWSWAACLVFLSSVLSLTFLVFSVFPFFLFLGGQRVPCAEGNCL